MTPVFFLQDFESDPKYRWGYAKLLRKNTVYIRTGQKHLGMKNGVFLDILISDGNVVCSAGPDPALCACFWNKDLVAPGQRRKKRMFQGAYFSAEARAEKGMVYRIDGFRV